MPRGFAATAYGVNADDTLDFRPGHRAAKNHRVLAPLLDVGMRKSEIRQLSQRAGLPTWDRPASACLASRIPYGTGLWPGFWLAAANQQWPPEIDILEHWGTDPVAKVYLHPKQGPMQGGPFTVPNLSKGWHTFTLYWTKSRLIWYYDGRQVMTTSTGIPQQTMYFIADLAVFNAQPGGCSGSLLIKSVKVWQPIGAEAST